jgi:hypothetical protein
MVVRSLFSIDSSVFAIGVFEHGLHDSPSGEDGTSRRAAAKRVCTSAAIFTVSSDTDITRLSDTWISGSRADACFEFIVLLG